MTITKKISKYLQIGLLLTFFLPFFPSGCREQSYGAYADSTVHTEALVPVVDTSIADTIFDTLVATNTNIDKLNVDSLENASKTNSDSEKKETISDKIIKRIPVLGYILKHDYKYSGIGFIVDTILYMLIGFGVVISFILWIIGLILKYKGHEWFHFMNITGIILFYIADPIMIGFFNTKLWGYWVSFWLASLMITLDLYVYFKIKRKTGA